MPHLHSEEGDGEGIIGCFSLTSGSLSPTINSLPDMVEGLEEENKREMALIYLNSTMP